jgi:hypothetical protein
MSHAYSLCTARPVQSAVQDAQRYRPIAKILQLYACALRRAVLETQGPSDPGAGGHGPVLLASLGQPLLVLCVLCADCCEGPMSRGEKTNRYLYHTRSATADAHRQSIYCVCGTQTAHCHSTQDSNAHAACLPTPAVGAQRSSAARPPAPIHETPMQAQGRARTRFPSRLHPPLCARRLPSRPHAAPYPYQRRNGIVSHCSDSVALANLERYCRSTCSRFALRIFDFSAATV